MTRSNHLVASRILIAVAAVWLAACAMKTIPAQPTAPKYPDFVYPAVPQTQQNTPAASAIDTGWRFLQNDNLRDADRAFSAAMKRNRSFYPALVGEGWVALARGNRDRALMDFDAALAIDRRYVPALIGRGQALLAQKKDEEALTAFENALAIDATLSDVRRRVEVLRFRRVQDLIDRAHAASRAGRNDDAIAAYKRAIDASPDSAFLYRELATIERKQGNQADALTHFRKAVDLDPSDAASWLEIGTLLDAAQDFDGALAAYRRAAAVESSPELTSRIAAATERAREASLPPEFRAIRQSAQITRGELAALIGVRFDLLLRTAPQRQAVMTDVRGDWASQWITAVVAAGVMDAFANHTFQPRQRIRRVDLATVVSRVLNLAAQRAPALRAKWSQRPTIADVAASNLSYPAVSAAVASGVMMLLDGQRFQLTRPVSGEEAIDTIERLRTVAGNVR